MDILYKVQNAQISCVAFDIFDTLIKRSVHPEYVKQIWAKQIHSKFGLDCNAKVLYAVRRRLEAQLCTENNKNGYDQEFQYHEMLKILFEEIKPDCALDEFIKICLEFELSSELRVQEPIGKMFEILQALKKEKVICICISDYYLPASYMERMLSHHGFDGYFSRIYVSCDYLASKRSGKLYETVLQQEGISPGKILMIGDNKLSDVDNAIRAGLHAQWVDSTVNHKHYAKLREKETDMSRWGRVINSCRQNGRDSCFANIAFSLYQFTQLLYESLLREGRKDVFFLSREGQF